MNLRDLQKIEDKLGELRDILNPEDSPYVCDTIVTNIADEDLVSLVEDMIRKMGYNKGMIKRVKIIINQIKQI